MKLGIMQPYFFPYLGYFALIKHTDMWVVFDTPQYIRHGWVNRNRILKPVEGWQYITIPLIKHGRSTSINMIRINDSTDWRKRIIGQLEHYKKLAPFYKSVLDLVTQCLSLKTDNLAELNIFILKNICEYIQIPFNFIVFSKMNIKIDGQPEPDEWSLLISKTLGASEYINPPGGIEFFDRSKFISSGINITFLSLNSSIYQQGYREFIPDLSIIDILMFNTLETVRAYLDNVVQIM